MLNYTWDLNTYISHFSFIVAVYALTATAKGVRDYERLVHQQFVEILAIKLAARSFRVHPKTFPSNTECNIVLPSPDGFGTSGLPNDGRSTSHLCWLQTCPHYPVVRLPTQNIGLCVIRNLLTARPQTLFLTYAWILTMTVPTILSILRCSRRPGAEFISLRSMKSLQWNSRSV